MLVPRVEYREWAFAKYPWHRAWCWRGEDEGKEPRIDQQVVCARARRSKGGSLSPRLLPSRLWRALPSSTHTSVLLRVENWHWMKFPAPEGAKFNQRFQWSLSILSLGMPRAGMVLRWVLRDKSFFQNLNTFIVEERTMYKNVILFLSRFMLHVSQYELNLPGRNVLFTHVP